MRQPQSLYLRHLFDKTKYRAAWLPNLPLKLGDIGRMEDGLFTIYTSLEMEGFKIERRESESGLGFDYSDKQSYEMHTSAAAGQGAARGQINIEFGSDGGIIFQMTKSRLQLIANMKEIEDTILARYRDKQWRKEWVVITQLVKADSATVFITTESKASLQLQCDIDVEIAAAKLADPSIHLSVVSESSSVVKIVAEANLTPLFQVKGIRQPFLGNPQLNYRSDPTAPVDSLLDLPFDPKEL